MFSGVKWAKLRRILPCQATRRPAKTLSTTRTANWRWPPWWATQSSHFYRRPTTEKHFWLQTFCRHAPFLPGPRNLHFSSQVAPYTIFSTYWARNAFITAFFARAVFSSIQVRCRKDFNNNLGVILYALFVRRLTIWEFPASSTTDEAK